MKISWIGACALLFAILLSNSTGFAQKNFGTGGSPILELAPDRVAPIAPQWEVMSCTHFKARVKNELQSTKDLTWLFDESADSAELDKFFRNRFAADPVDVVAERVAQVQWSVPRIALSATPQVYALFEEATMDFQGAQMHFETPGRKVSITQNQIVVQSPIRMLDVCMKDYVDLKLFSQCPVDKFNFWRPDPSNKPFPHAINYPQCKKVETVRLKLDSVESALEDNKVSLHRGGDKLPINVNLAPPSCTADTLDAAKMLEALLPVRRLHNCSVDVVKRVSEGEAQYSIYARDEFSCQSSVFDCLETEFSIAVPAQCIGVQSVSPHISYTNKIERASETRAEIMRTQMNRDQQVMGLSITKMNSKTGKRTDHVVCQPDIFRGQYEN